MIRRLAEFLTILLAASGLAHGNSEVPTTTAPERTFDFIYRAEVGPSRPDSAPYTSSSRYHGRVPIRRFTAGRCMLRFPDLHSEKTVTEISSGTEPSPNQREKPLE